MKIGVGRAIQILYVKRSHLEYTLSKALKNMLIKKHSFPYTMLQFNPTLATVVKFGIYFIETQSTRLQKLHNRAARVIACVPNEVDQQTVLNILGWEPLKEQRVKAKAKIMVKTLNNMGPNCLKELFTFQKEILNRSLRNSSSTIRLPKPNTNNMKKSFMYDGASIWNSLPKNIRESNSLSSFKRKIATYSL